jgi:hypothetical protein
MKYIRKFNENITDSHLKVNDLLKDIFAELIDDASIQVEIKLESFTVVKMRRICVDIKPWAKKQSMATKMETEEMIARYEKYLELVKDIEVCYKRAVDELPDIKSELMVAVDNRIYIYFHLPVDPKTTMKWTDVDHMTDDELFRDID